MRKTFIYKTDFYYFLYAVRCSGTEDIKANKTDKNPCPWGA